MTDLEMRIYEYLKTVEKASPRKIARALEEDRHRVKIALATLTNKGVLDNLAERILIAEEIFSQLFIEKKSALNLGMAGSPKATPSAPTTEIKTEVRRM